MEKICAVLIVAALLAAVASAETAGNTLTLNNVIIPELKPCDCAQLALLDINDDTEVSILDIAALQQCMGKTAPDETCTADDFAQRDLNADRVVSILDIAAIAQCFATGIPQDCYTIPRAELTLATEKASYRVDERITLTDPPVAASGPSQKTYTHAADVPAALGEFGALGYIVEFREEPLIQKKTLLESGLAKPAGISTDQLLQDHLQQIQGTHDLFAQDASAIIASSLGKPAGAAPLAITHSYTETFNGVALDLTSSQAAQIKQLSYVRAVYQDQPVQAALQDSVPLIHADILRTLNVNGAGITIAIIDTGIDASHPSLDDMDDDPDTADPKVIVFKDLVSLRTNPYDDHLHGTHVADIAAGTGGGTDYIGVAPGAHLVGVKVLDEFGSGYESDIIAGIEWVAQNKDRYNIRVASMSLGGFGAPDSPMSRAADLAVADGITMVVAAGNSGPSGPPWCRTPLDPLGNAYSICAPGNAYNVITVGAVDNNGAIARFSSRGPTTDGRLKPDLVAPGVRICAALSGDVEPFLTCDPQEERISISGTSMATPHVSGLAALLLQQNPILTPQQVKTLLQETATDAGPAGPDNAYGYGMAHALNSLFSLNPPEFELSADRIEIDDWVELGDPQVVRVTISNPGRKTLIKRVRFTVNDVEVESKLTPIYDVVSSLSIYGRKDTQVEFNWAPAEEGEYTLRISVDAQDGEATTTNNILAKQVKVVQSDGMVRVAVLDSWASDFPYNSILGELQDSWFNFGSYIMLFDTKSLNKEGITYADLVASDAGILLISDAWYNSAFLPGVDGFWQFTDSEIQAIARYTQEGHGLIATSGTFSDTNVLNNIKMAPLFGLREQRGDWSIPYDRQFTLLTSDPVLSSNLPNTFESDIYLNIGGLELNNEVPVSLVAESADHEAFVTAYRPDNGASVYFTHMPENRDANQFDKQLFYNALVWAALNSGQHDIDLAAYDLAAPETIRVNQEVEVSAKLINLGQQSENVMVRLLANGREIGSEVIAAINTGQVHDLRFSWAPHVQGQTRLDVEAEAKPDEQVIFNNIASRVVAVSGAYFNGNAHDQGIDQDNDGKFDQLVAEMGVTVLVRGEYRVCAVLQSSYGAVIGGPDTGEQCSSLQPLGVGNDMIPLEFDGFAIRKMGLNGPYRITDLRLFDVASIADRVGEYRTQAYTADQFETGADLAILDVEAGPEQVFINEPLEVSVTIQNQGTETAENAQLAISDEDADIIIHTVPVGPILPGETATYRITLRSGTVGNINYRATATAENEVNDLNNWRTFSAYFAGNGVDLQLEGLSADALFLEENEMTLTVRNIGTEDSGQGKMLFYAMHQPQYFEIECDRGETIYFEGEEITIDCQIDNGIPMLHFTSDTFESTYPFVVHNASFLFDNVIIDPTQYRGELRFYLGRGRLQEQLITPVASKEEEQLTFSWLPESKGEYLLIFFAEHENEINYANNKLTDFRRVVERGADLTLNAQFWGTKFLGEEFAIPVTMFNFGTETAQDVELLFYEVQDFEQYFLRVGEPEDIRFNDEEFDVLITQEQGQAHLSLDGEDIVLYPGQFVQVEDILVGLDYLASDWAAIIIGRGKLQRFPVDDIASHLRQEMTIDWEPTVAGKHILAFEVISSNDVEPANNYFRQHILAAPPGPNLQGRISGEYEQYPGAIENEIYITNVGNEPATGVHATYYDLNLSIRELVFGQRTSVRLDGTEYIVTVSPGEQIRVEIQDIGTVSLEDKGAAELDGLFLRLQSVSDFGARIELGRINEKIVLDVGTILPGQEVVRQISGSVDYYGGHAIQVLLTADQDADRSDNLIKHYFSVEHPGPDLAVFTRFNENYLVVNKENRIELELFNQGNEPAENAELRVYRDVPDRQPGELIYSESGIRLDPDERMDVEFAYVPDAPGFVPFAVEVDLLDDFNQYNNKYHLTMHVAPQSRIRNTGMVTILGVLSMEVRKLDGGSSRIVIDNELVRIRPQEEMALDTLFNAQRVRISEPGDYVVYAVVRDDLGDPIKTKTGTLEGYWEFDIR
ncbi:MAG TPA: S8 family serine peptidase [Candidatus Nanoarchaeia archaeon]|nr:S8 family serine peptidase [Candidatus Nanoarchaeia archaeon]